MTEKQELIEAWTAPLEDNAEQHLQARSLLGEAIDENAVTLPAAAKWMPRPCDHRKRRVMLWVLFILAFVGFLYPVLTTYGMQVASKAYSLDIPLGASKAPQVRSSSAEETFILYGDLSRSNRYEQRRALWERDPQNAAYFAEYATHYISEKGVVPPDFLKTAAELDPENAWYLVTAAATKSKEVCRKEKTIHPRSPVTSAKIAGVHGEELNRMRRKIVYQYTIVDPVAMQEVLALWRQSLRHKRYENYATSLHKMRYPILSQHVSFVRNMTNIVYLFDSPLILIGERYLTDILVTALQNADMQSEEGKQLFRDITAYTERVAATEPNSLVDVLLSRVNIDMLYKQIDVIDTSSLDPVTVATWQRRKAALQQLHGDLSKLGRTQTDFLRNHASLLTALSVSDFGNKTTNPLQLSKEDLMPMRYTEHCIFLHLLAAICSVLLLTMVPYHIWGRNAKLSHRLSDTVWLSMSWRSLAWMIASSVAVPLLYFTALTLWTPLTGKEYGAGRGFLFPFAPAISVALIIFMLPRLLSHRFIATWQKLQPQRKSWYLRFGWAAFVLLLLPLHLLPWMIRVTESEDYIVVFVGICWLPAILWLLWTLIGGFLTRGFYPAVMHSLRRRAVGACTLSSIILLSLTCWALKQCESYWLKKDTVIAVSPDKPTLRYEAEITKHAHADLRGAMLLRE